MNNYDDLRGLIQKTINAVYLLKCFTESVTSCLGDENDTEKIYQSKLKADLAEKEIEENLVKLSKLNLKKNSSTPKRIKNYANEKVEKKKKKLQGEFENTFKGHLLLYGFKLKRNPVTVDMKKLLSDMKTNTKRLFKAVEFLDYSRDEKNFKVRARFLFGIDLIMHIEDCCIGAYSIKLQTESLVLKQLLSLFEIKWEFEVNVSDRNLYIGLQKMSRWLEIRRFFYTEKCKVCDLHLSFKSGTPMVPLAVFQGNYFHIDCYYDFQKELYVEC